MKSYFNIFKNLYIDLDAILDTRLGTLFTLDKNLYNFYLKNKDYYNNRLIDEFEYIPSNVFKYYYKKRNKQILKHSPLTPILDIINITIEDMLTKRIMSDKNIKKLVIDINTYPYLLTKKEIEKLKLTILSKIKNEFIVVNIINTPYEHLTSSICEQYGVMVMYDGYKWLDIRGLLKDIKNTLPNTHLLLPYKLHNPIIFNSSESIEKYFKQIEELFKYYIKIEYNRIEIFNSIK